MSSRERVQPSGPRVVTVQRRVWEDGRLGGGTVYNLRDWPLNAPDKQLAAGDVDCV